MTTPAPSPNGRLLSRFVRVDDGSYATIVRESGDSVTLRTVLTDGQSKFWDVARSRVTIVDDAPIAPQQPQPQQSARLPKRSANGRLAPDTTVKAGDRDNYGTVVRDHGDMVTVRFVSDAGKTATVDIPRDQLTAGDALASVGADAEGFRLNPVSNAEFDKIKYTQKFLVHKILVGKQPCVIGGKQKTLKTSVAVDLAISVGSGTRFLDVFETDQCRTMILSGESGGFTLQETARRIVAAKGITMADVDIYWEFKLPQITKPEHVAALADSIKEHKVQLTIIDPAYLCLLGGNVKGLQASNLFDMGPLLLHLSDVMAETGSTIVIAHHCRKNAASGADPYAVPELEDLTMSGFAEWARQWLLLGRREPYEQGSGEHRLWLNVGGSAGHSGCWALDIDEGQFGDDFLGRRWEVSVESVANARQAATDRKERKKAERQERAEDERRRKLVEVLRQFPAGETAKVLRTAASLNPTYFGTAVRDLLKMGLAETCQVLKHTRHEDGFRLTKKGRER